MAERSALWTATEKVRELLDVIDQLRELFHDKRDGITLPAIAVIGNQSSGKSSVLERLSGVELPRGEGMVTKCALVLRMCCDPDLKEPFAVITGGTVKSKRIALGDVAANINDITSTLVSDDIKISQETITLQVVAPHVPDLTLIDLPGIVYRDEQASGAGGHPQIKDDIKRLYMSHIKNESCVILCVMPADVDAATQEATLWAEEVDPKGERTVGVVTKIDKADITDTRLGERLLGRGKNAWKFKLGAVAMRNRSQAQIDAGDDVQKVSQEEQRYFESHPGLNTLPSADRSNVLGAGALIKKLVAIQSEAVLKAIPQLQSDMASSLRAKEAQLAALPPACTQPFECHVTFNKQLDQFAETIRDVLEARHERLKAFKTPANDSESSAVAVHQGSADAAMTPRVTSSDTRDLHMMPRLQEYFDTFQENVREDSRVIFDADFHADVKRELDESRGPSLPDMPNPAVFKQFVGRMAEELGDAAHDLAQTVHDYTCTFCDALVEQFFSGFPSLHRFVQAALHDLLQESFDRTKAHIDEQLELEAEEFTMDNYYSQQLLKLRARIAEEISEGTYPASWDDEKALDCTEGLLEPIPPKSQAPTPSRGTYVSYVSTPAPATSAAPNHLDNAGQAVLNLQMQLFCYRKVVHKRFTDQVAAYIRLHFPRRLRDHAREYLHRAVVQEEGQLQCLMAEPEHLRNEREQLVAAIQRIKEGMKMVRAASTGGLVASTRARNG
eukprot:m.68135 g.68135  ORF g.68135 m.68135 type:complete len:729 (-) comp7484_c0_seq2:77-2263(-)